jgi:hypothetical protein
MALEGSLYFVVTVSKDEKGEGVKSIREGERYKSRYNPFQSGVVHGMPE